MTQYSSPVCSANMVRDITCDDPLLETSVIVDVREQDEFDAGHIEGAIHLPLSELQKNPDIYKAPENNKTVVVYCARGMRSKKAIEILQSAGHTNLHNLAGGYFAWVQKV